MTDEVMNNLERLNTERMAKTMSEPLDLRAISGGVVGSHREMNKIFEEAANKAMKDGWAKDVERMRAEAVAEENRREDHAMALLLSLTGSGLIQWGSPADLDELARDCVRTVRVLESEAAEATARRQPTAAERRPRSQPAIRPLAEEGLGLGQAGAGGGPYDDAEEGERW